MVSPLEILVYESSIDTKSCTGQIKIILFIRHITFLAFISRNINDNFKKYHFPGLWYIPKVAGSFRFWKNLITTIVIIARLTCTNMLEL
jgi:hypothetical protein